MFWIATALAATIMLPAIIGVFRYHYIKGNNRWLILLVWMGAVNEFASLLTAFVFKTNAGTSNIYILLETFMLLVLFHRWNAIQRTTAWCTAVVLFTLWYADNFCFSSLHSFYGFYPVLYALIMVFLSVKLMLRTAAAETHNVFTNGRYIASAAFVLYFSMKALAESFFVFDDGLSLELQTRLIMITLITNAISNILYIHALLCFHRKTGYSLEYS